MIAAVNGDGELVQRPKSKSMRSITLTKPGEVFTVEENEVLDLSIPSALDLGRYSLSIVPSAAAVTAGPSMFDIGIERNCVPRILVNRTCQKINWYNPFVLPEVVVDNPNDQQLVYTPLYNPDTLVIGYEIRLGDHEECNSNAFKVWKRMSRNQERWGKDVAAYRRKLPASTKDKPTDISSITVIVMPSANKK